MGIRVKPCALTPAQAKKWEDTRCALQWACPAFTHIFYTMLSYDDKTYALFTDDEALCPIAATDGSSLILNPKTFFEFPLEQRVMICAHEIMHCVWDHCGLMHKFRNRKKVPYADGSELPYDQELMNVATDLIINDLLIESKVGAMPMKDGKRVGLHDKSVATGQDSAIDAYRKVWKNPPPGRGGFDVHLPPGSSKGQDPTQADKARNQTAWDTEIVAAAHAAKAQGKLAAGLERVFLEVLNPQVDWRDKIKGLFARKVGSGSYDWRRADRRLICRDIYAPGRSGFGAGCVVVGVDTSGSIGQKELDMFFAEMAGILEDVKPKRLVIMWCDAHVHRVDEAEDASDLNVIRSGKAPGGGGTSFVPVFEEIGKMGLEPDALVYLTDGMGTFPDKGPSYPVIWGSIYNSSYPFGDVVDVPKQK